MIGSGDLLFGKLNLIIEWHKGKDLFSTLKFKEVIKNFEDMLLFCFDKPRVSKS